MTDSSLSPEIIKLMDKIAENPNSRLFVPLAEEYLNSDLPDEAIQVLNNGIEKHPTYVAARIMLGKIYLEKNQPGEAKSEFEKVLEINPENILAHKKLAIIYQKEGEPQRAVESYRQILAVDPSDKESKNLLAVLEEELSPATLSEASEPTPGGGNNFEIEKTPTFETSDETRVTSEDPFSSDTEIVPDPVDPFPSDQVTDKTAEVAPPEDLAELENETGFDLEEQWQPEAIPQNEENPLEAAMEASSPAPDPLPEQDVQETPATNSLAALYIDQGCYQEAADIYKKCLERDPTDRESKDGLEKALGLLSEKSPADVLPSPELTGKTGEKSSQKTQTERLQLWLDTIQKKKKGA